MVKQLEESKLLDPGHLLKTTDFIEGDEGDIEDLIGWELYATLVNGACGDPCTEPATSDKARRRGAADCQGGGEDSQTSSAWRPRVRSLCSCTVPQLLTHEVVAQLPGLPEALDRFERVFARLNALIGND